MHPFDDPWPAFFTYLDDDPQRGMALFWEHGLKQLRVCPPSVLKSVPIDERSDLIRETLFHCIDNDFRVLRTYRNEGKPFARWFMRTATREVLQWLRKTGKQPVTMENDFENIPNGFDSNQTGAAGTPELVEAVRIVDECIVGLQEYCQLLIRLAGDEFKPSEMALLLGRPKSEAAQISADIRQCRKKLARIVAERGLDPTLRDIGD